MDLNQSAPAKSWRFNRSERVWIGVALFALFAFGANVEQRTALRRTPMTDLGVFSCAAGAVLSGQNLYSVTDWHGWHYQYPPALAILFTPLAMPVPVAPANLPAGVLRTAANTPWGYGIAGHHRFFGLHAENARFFCIVGIWYVITVMLIFLSAHLLASALEGRGLRAGPPLAPSARRRWWWLRTLPLLACAGSLATNLSRGQVDILLLAAMALALYLAANGRYGKAGFWLSLPATVKLFPVLLITYPVWRLRWRMMAGAAAGLVLALALIPMMALGPSRTAELYRDWVDVLAKPALGQGSDRTRSQELTGMAGTDNQSLLAFIHNWRFHDLPREKRPPEAPPGERYAAYAIGALLLLGVALAMGVPRVDSPGDLLIIAGLLMGVAVVVNPVSHNDYFLFLLPLVAGLLYRSWRRADAGVGNSKTLVVIAAFMLTDVLARMPVIGPWLRDAGVPLISLVAMMGAGAFALREQEQSAASIPLPVRAPAADVIAGRA